MQSFARYLFPTLVGVFALACLYGLRGDLALLSFGPLVRSWDLVVLATLCSLGNYTLRIVRWQRYLTRLGCAVPLGFSSLAYIAGFAFTVSPGKVGEVARARYYARFGIALPDVAGAFFLERLMDLVAMMVLAALITAAVPHYQFAMSCAGAATLLILAVMALLPWPTLAQRLSAASQLPRAVQQIAAAAAQALAAARSLLSPGALLGGFALGLAAWGLEGLGFFALGSIYPAAHLSALTGVGIYAVAVLLGALSFLPGGLGSTEAVMTALLTTQGFSVADALLVTIACRLVTLWLAVALGWAAIWALRQRLVPAVP